MTKPECDLKNTRDKILFITNGILMEWMSGGIALEEMGLSSTKATRRY